MEPHHLHDSDRPPFMATLGLLPPYSLEDVAVAYRSHVLKVHPDHGGNEADFLVVQRAYERAVEYVGFHDNRRGWIAARVDDYLHQREAADEVARLGGHVEIEEFDWLKHSLGDGFAMLADRLQAIRLQDKAADDAFLAFLAGPPLHVPYLHSLNLAGTRITDTGLHSLATLKTLKHLNLAGTRITSAGIETLPERLPELESIDLEGTEVGLFSAWRLQRVLRRRRAEIERRKAVILLE